MGRLLMIRWFAAAAVAALFFAAGASAAKPPDGSDHSFAWELINLDAASVVEQQPGVVNPDGCLWDIDDNWKMGDLGNLPSGGQASASHCLIADGAYHLTGASVAAPSPDLAVTIRFDPQAVVFTLAPVQTDRRSWLYRGCVTGPLYGNWPALPEIPDSNDGNGLETVVMVTVANRTGRVVRDVNATLEFGSDSPGPRQGYCNTKSEPFEAGGAVWSTGL